MLGFTNISEIVVPGAAEPWAPVTPEELLATVQVKLLEAVECNGIVSNVLLQTNVSRVLVTAGEGLTLMVMAVGVLVQDPTEDIGVTR